MTPPDTDAHGTEPEVTGPLGGVRVIELAGIGPAPFCGMVLADLGAEVVRIDRPGGSVLGFTDSRKQVLHRGRRMVCIDLKHPDGGAAALGLIDAADVLIEGFRPGVMERLGLGPDVCLARNPRLVYGRVTGWGQEGPMAARAGHDIDYIAVAGALGAFRRPGGRPLPPVNLVGDFGGGGMLLAVGVLAGLIEARSSGRGQVVDAAMVDGSALLTTMLWGMRADGGYDDRAPGTNLLDTGAPFYDVYPCADGGFVAVGALEPGFYEELIRGLELDGAGLPAQGEVARWPELRDRIAAAFAAQPRDHWVRVFEAVDACVAPVLDFDEAMAHPHNAARGTFLVRDGTPQPAPAPRFSRTPASGGAAPGHSNRDTAAVLRDWGMGDAELARLLETGAIR